MDMTSSDLASLIEAHWQLGDQFLRARMGLAPGDRGKQSHESLLPALLADLCDRPGDRARECADQLMVRGVFVVTLLDANYPDRIRILLGEGAPPVLYCCGNSSLFRRRGISIIGTRRPTTRGTAAARAYARSLAHARYIIVSGNAPGIDAAAHDEALRSGGCTLVFPPTPMDQYSPRFAAEASPSHILVATPFAPGLPFQKYYPLRRNQLVAAQALGAIVAETGTRGGTLNTVRHVRAFGRPLFVVHMPPNARHHIAPSSLVAGGAVEIPLIPTAETMRSLFASATKPLPRTWQAAADLFQAGARQ